MGMLYSPAMVQRLSQILNYNYKTMEVILKKTKITSSILKQSLRSTKGDLASGEILGWCMYNGAKYIVCYLNMIVSIYPMFVDIVKTSYPKDGSNVEYRIEVKLGGRYVSLLYYNNNEDSADAFVSTLKRAKRTAEQAGQFYI